MDGISVVVADDEATIRTALAELLNLRPGLTVVGSAADGAQAVQLIRAFHPDVAILDADMPVMSGIAACAAVAGTGVRVIILTASVSASTMRDAMAAGAAGFLTKSASVDASPTGRQRHGREYLRAGGLYVIVVQLMTVGPFTLAYLLRVHPRGSATWAAVAGVACLFVGVCLVVTGVGRGLPASSRAVRVPQVVVAVVSPLVAAGCWYVEGRTGQPAATLVAPALFLGAYVAAIRSAWWGAITAAVTLAGCLAVGMDGRGAALLVTVLVTNLATCRLSMWIHGLIRELAAARLTIAQFSVERERLRFARDLHDVVGRTLSSLALKAELGIARSTSADKDVALSGIADISREALTRMRQLVSGYREVTLGNEIDDGCLILRSAGVYVEVAGNDGRHLGAVAGAGGRLGDPRSRNQRAATRPDRPGM